MMSTTVLLLIRVQYCIKSYPILFFFRFLFLLKLCTVVNNIRVEVGRVNE